MKNKEISQVVDQLVYQALSANAVSVDWCPEFDKIRKDTISAKRLQRSINTLILHNRKIDKIDCKFTTNYKKVKSLALSGNFIENIEFLPPNLEVLHLNANKLHSIPERLGQQSSLLHLGLAFNNIQVLNPIIPIYSLVSLDLSYNQIYNIEDTVNSVKVFGKLKCLSLAGNPICLLPGYPAAIIAALPQLRYFDDCEILTELRAQPVILSSNTKMTIQISKLIGLTLNPGNNAEDIGYSISVYLNEIPAEMVTTESKIWNQDGIQFDHSQSISFEVLPTSMKVIKGGLTLNLICEKYAVERKKPLSPKEAKAEKNARKKPGKDEIVAEKKIVSSEVVKTSSLNLDGLVGITKRIDTVVKLDESVSVGISISL